MVGTDTFPMIALGEEPLGTLGNDDSVPLLLPFHHSLHFEYLGKAESAQQLAVELCRFLNIRDLDLEVVNRMLELIFQDWTRSLLVDSPWPLSSSNVFSSAISGSMDNLHIDSVI